MSQLRCFVHGTTQSPGCPACLSIHRSVSLNRIYADIEDARTRAQMEPLKAEWAGRDLSRDGAPESLAEMVENIHLWCKGEVE